MDRGPWIITWDSPEERKDELFRLAGLTPAQYDVLHLASVGAVTKAHARTLKSLAALIGADRRCTKAGYQVMRLVETLADADWYVGPRECIPMAPRLREYVNILRNYRDGRLRSVHIKAMMAIYNDGSLSERFLGRVYGCTCELVDWGFAEASMAGPQAEGWRVYHLTTAGNWVMQDLMLLIGGESL